MTAYPTDRENIFLWLRAERRLGRRLTFILTLITEIMANGLAWFVWAQGPVNGFPWPLPFTIFAAINLIAKLLVMFAETKQFDALSQRLVEREIALLQQDYEVAPRLLEKMNEVGFEQVRSKAIERLQWRTAIHNTISALILLGIFAAAFVDKTIPVWLSTFPVEALVAWAKTLPMMSCGILFILTIIASVLIMMTSPPSYLGDHVDNVIAQQDRALRSELRRMLSVREDRVPLAYRWQQFWQPIERELERIRVWVSLYNEISPEKDKGKGKRKQPPTVRLTDDGELVSDDSYSIE